MKRVLAVLCAAVLLVSLFSLAACGKSKSDSSSSESSSKAVSMDGTYLLTKYIVSGQDYTSLMPEMTMEVKDNVGTVKTEESSLVYTFDPDAGTVTYDEESVPYTFDGKTIKMSDTNTDSSITFEKK